MNSSIRARALIITAAALCIPGLAHGQVGRDKIVIPAGTTMLVRLLTEVSTATQRSGARFETVLQEPIAVGEVVVAPAGTLIYGIVLRSEGGKKVGKQHLAATLYEMRLNGRVVPILTDTVALEEKAGGALAMIGGGTLLGGILGGAGGAAAGAIAGTGAAAVTDKRHITIPAGTVGKVHLRNNVTVPNLSPRR